MGEPCNGQSECNECTGYDTTGPLVWVGIDRVIQGGQLDDSECGIGCTPCPDDSLNMTPIGIWGGRWLRPHPSLANRMANGKLGDLRSIGMSNEHLINVRRVPLRMNYQRAACYIQPGTHHEECEECFDEDACYCDNPLSTYYGQCSGTTENPIVSGRQSDSFFYRGIGWPPHSMDEVWCRKVENHGPMTVEVVPESEITPLMMGTVLRSEDIDQNYKPVACTSNALVPCMGVSVAQYENCTRTPQTDGTPYVDGVGSADTQRLAWTYIGCHMGDAALRVGTNMLRSEGAAIAAKNQVLERLREPFPDDFKFDRLDNQALKQGDTNHGLYEWGRGWNASQGIGPDPVVYHGEGSGLGSIPDNWWFPVLSIHNARDTDGPVSVTFTVLADMANPYRRIECKLNDHYIGGAYPNKSCDDGPHTIPIEVSASDYNTWIAEQGSAYFRLLVDRGSQCSNQFYQCDVSYTAAGSAVTYDDLPIVPEVFKECRLLFNPSCKVLCEMLIVEAHITFQLNAQLITDALPGVVMSSDNLLLFPFARARVFVKTGIRAQMVDENGNDVSECNGLTIVNPDSEWFGEGQGDYSLRPRVTRLGEVAQPNRYDQPDRIVYVGHKWIDFEPPRDVYWWGFLGDSSNPRTADQWHRPLGSPPVSASLSGKCCWLGKALSPLIVGGWPHAVESHPDTPDSVYTGVMHFDFTTGLYPTHCGEDK